MSTKTPRIESEILRNLLFNERYVRKILPYIQPNYFHDEADRKIFELCAEYVAKYNALPTSSALHITLKELSLNQTHYDNCKELLEGLTTDDTVKDDQQQWLDESTEEWCQQRAIYNGIMESISIMEGNSKAKTKNAIPEILSDALAVSFDTNIGHDFVEDTDKRFEFYHRKEQKIPFDLTMLNTVTGGGLAEKTLSVILASTGAGKSLAMCHMASANLALGKNVLYITLEMAEEKIAERIDANLLDVSLDDLKDLSEKMYQTKFDKLRTKINGKLIIKEYPPACASVSNFRHLLTELKLKKKFIPDIIYVDYINLAISSRYKHGANINSYTLIKSIAEELRGLAVERKVPIVTATQTNREGAENSDVSITNTSESFGLPATADLMFALITTDELAALNQVMIKQLKNRYSDVNVNKKFVLGVDKSKMRLYDVQASAQSGISDSGQTASDSTRGGYDKSMYDDFTV